MLKDALIDRLAALQKRRAEIAAEGVAKLAEIDTQITACRTLAQNWDTYTVDEALAALAQTGVRLKLES